jgi:hypothetical protein
MIDDQATAEVAHIQHLHSILEEVSTANTDAGEDTNYQNVPQARGHGKGRGRGVGTRWMTMRGHGHGHGRP